MDRRGLLDPLLIALAIVIGTGSIALFAAAEIVRHIDLHLSARNALLWDSALSLLFFVQHSGMVRRSFRARLAAAVPLRYHGAFYTIASGLVLAAVVILWQAVPRPLFTMSSAGRILALAGALTAIAGFLWTARTAGSFDLLGIRPILDHMRRRGPRPPRFVARGAYLWVRHPLYSCVLLLLWCTPVITADRLLLNVLWSAWIVAGAMFEERDLAADFGEVYRDYRRRVPMLIPWRGRVRLDAALPATPK